MEDKTEYQKAEKTIEKIMKNQKIQNSNKKSKYKMKM
jgi:hypothetical protein